VKKHETDLSIICWPFRPGLISPDGDAARSRGMRTLNHLPVYMT